MTHIFKIFTISAFVLLGTVCMSSVTYAQEDSIESLRSEIAELRQTHTELKAQVQAGELTREEAQARWLELVKDVRLKKDQIFEQRMNQIKEKFEVMAEKYPEQAEALKERMENAQKLREEAQQKREEIREKLQSGEITPEEAKEMRQEMFQERKEVFETFKETQQTIREERKENIMEQRGERRENPRIKDDTATKTEDELENETENENPADDNSNSGDTAN